MNSNNTPRTDAETTAFVYGCAVKKAGGDYVIADFARQLERELAAVRKSAGAEATRPVCELPRPSAAQAASPDAERIVAAIEGTLREWIMPTDRPAVLEAVDSVLRDHDPAGLYFLAKQDVRELWEKHLGPHKCAVDGVEKFLNELETWMMEEKP